MPKKSKELNIDSIIQSLESDSEIENVTTNENDTKAASSDSESDWETLKDSDYEIKTCLELINSETELTKKESDNDTKYVTNEEALDEREKNAKLIKVSQETSSNETVNTDEINKMSSRKTQEDANINKKLVISQNSKSNTQIDKVEKSRNRKSEDNSTSKSKKKEKGGEQKVDKSSHRNTDKNVLLNGTDKNDVKHKVDKNSELRNKTDDVDSRKTIRQRKKCTNTDISSDNARKSRHSKNSVNESPKQKNENNDVSPATKRKKIETSGNDNPNNETKDNAIKVAAKESSKYGKKRKHSEDDENSLHSDAHKDKALKQIVKKLTSKVTKKRQKSMNYKNETKSKKSDNSSQSEEDDKPLKQFVKMKNKNSSNEDDLPEAEESDELKGIEKHKLTKETIQAFHNLSEKIMRKQNLFNSDFYPFTVPDMKVVLKLNDQPMDGKRNDLIKIIKNNVQYGCPPRCSNCKWGRLKYGKKKGKWTFFCRGYYTKYHWRGCSYTITKQNIKLIPWKNP